MSTQEVTSYNPVKAAIADLEHRYKNVVFDASTTAGMSTAKAAYKDINGYSIMLEAARVKEKADSLAYGRFVDSEAKRIADQLDALRLPIKTVIDEVAKREQREREAAIKAEQDRIAAEQGAAKAAEEKRMAEARAEIARQQAELAKAQQARLAEEAAARRKIEEEGRAARVAIEEAERAARLQCEAADRVALQQRQAAEAEAKAIRDAEEARLKAERDEIDRKARLLAEAQRREQDRIDAEARRVREEAEAKQREEDRRRQEAADTEQAIRALRKRISGIERYARIAAEIDRYITESQA